MEYEVIAKRILHQLGIGLSYKGYAYILYSLDLILQDENLLTCITKILYVDVAHKFHTSSKCVERDIRKVLDVIWTNVAKNQSLIEKIFGTRHLTLKPSNKEFLELLFQYVSSYNSLQKVYPFDKMICPISNERCTACKEMLEIFINLK